MKRTELNRSHPALHHKVIYAPNPGSLEFDLGSITANPIFLGDRMEPHEGMDAWWPDAISANVREKMFRRILRCEHGLAVHLGVAISILSEIYTTTSGRDGEAKGEKRVRLGLSSSPIADFGIVASKIRVPPSDALAYSFMKGGRHSGPKRCGDPTDHHHLYFTAVNGTEWHLDLDMYQFNLCTCIPNAPYFPEGTTSPQTQGNPPAYVRDRLQIARDKAMIEAGQATPLHAEYGRFSVLRDESLHRAVASRRDAKFTSDGEDIVFSFMQRVSQRLLPSSERKIMRDMISAITVPCRTVFVENEEWRTWPEQPKMIVENDPDESMEPETCEEKEVWKEILAATDRSTKSRRHN